MMMNCFPDLDTTVNLAFHTYFILNFVAAVSFVSVTVIFWVKSAVLSFLFIFVKLTIESRNIELFCNQF
jgi:hypothetical protein